MQYESCYNPDQLDTVILQDTVWLVVSVNDEEVMEMKVRIAANVSAAQCCTHLAYQAP